MQFLYVENFGGKETLFFKTQFLPTALMFIARIALFAQPFSIKIRGFNTLQSSTQRFTENTQRKRLCA